MIDINREQELKAELKAIRKAKARVAYQAKKQEHAEERERRAVVVANNVAAVVADKAWPAFGSFDEFAQAAYESALANGAADDAYFTDAAKGLIHFKRVLRGQKVKVLLPKLGTLLYVRAKAVGTPDVETIVAIREKRAQAIENSISNENTRRDEARALAGVELPKMEVRLLGQ